MDVKQIIVSISLLALLPGCTGLESSSPNGQAADARGLPLIDMHMHAIPLEAYPSEWGTPPFRNPATGELSAATNNGAVMAASVRAMTRSRQRIQNLGRRASRLGFLTPQNCSVPPRLRVDLVP